MTFQFASQQDADMFKTLSGLVKFNNGQFKSVKQADFLFKVFSRENLWDTASAKSLFNVDLTEGQVMVAVNAYARWADYGSRSVRPVTWKFVVDREGVVAQYKLGYVGDMRSGTSPDPSKTELLWSRQGEITPLERPVVVAEANTSQHIGEVGKRMTFKGVVKFVKTFDRPKFHYYDSGVGYITHVDVDGSTVVYFGSFGSEYERGSAVEFVATVKEHGEYQGVKQTVVNRPRVV